MKYPKLEQLEELCKSFIGKKITLTATFGETTIPIKNPNLVGDLLENIFYPSYKEICPDFEEGPKQESPDFFAQNREFFFEQKCFKTQAHFDIGNFSSFVHQLAAPGGLIKKLFKTKYLVYEYGVTDDGFDIKNFWLLDLWNLPGYNKNTCPITMQVKKGMWYNIRPASKTTWYDKEKTPAMFMIYFLECMERHENFKNNEDLRKSIINQMKEAESLGLL